jgi:hypothetical protein
MDLHTPRLFLMTAPVLWFWVYLFWGGLESSTRKWFLVGTLYWAGLCAVRGWEPWAMAIHRLLHGLPPAPVEQSPIQMATSAFFKLPRCRAIQGVTVAAGGVIPWIIQGISAACGGRPLRPGTYPTPGWAMIIMGLVEGIRGCSVAYYLLAGELQREWPSVLESASRFESDSRMSS